MQRLDVRCQIGMTKQTKYRRTKKFGGIDTELERIKKENEPLRRAVPDLTLEI